MRTDDDIIRSLVKAISEDASVTLEIRIGRLKELQSDIEAAITDIEADVAREQYRRRTGGN